ncbi:MAG: DMT family transporter [Burkholderiaceae bacterium]|nr:DMT family transporter [Burkholderiaceae bacterium]
MKSIVQSCWMLVAAVLYTVMAIFIKYAVETFSVYEIIFYRSLFGLALLIPILKKTHISLRSPVAGLQFGRNFFTMIHLALGAYILWVLPIGTAQTLKYTAPLFFAMVLAIESVMIGARFSKNLLIPLGLAFISVALIARPDLDPNLLFGMMLGLLCGLTGGIGDFFIKLMADRDEPSERTLFWFIVSGILFGVVGTLAGDGFHAVGWIEFALLVGIALTGTLAQYANTYAYNGGDPLLINIFMYAGVFFSIVSGLILFAEVPDTLTVIGCTGICVSGVLAGYLKYRSKENE